MHSNRRDLLLGAGALAAAALLPGGARAATRGGGEPKLWDVVVVGAGLAGLNAAMLLES